MTTDHARAAEHYRTQADAAQVTVLRALLAECRAALPAEYCGYTDSLAGRIDDVLHSPVRGEPVQRNGLPDCVYCGYNSHWSQVCPALPDEDRRPRVGQVTASESPRPVKGVGGGTEEPETEPLVPFSSPRHTSLAPPVQGEPVLGSLGDGLPELVWERIPNGEFGWFRA